MSNKPDDGGAAFEAFEVLEWRKLCRAMAKVIKQAEEALDADNCDCGECDSGYCVNGNMTNKTLLRKALRNYMGAGFIDEDEYNAAVKYLRKLERADKESR